MKKLILFTLPLLLTYITPAEAPAPLALAIPIALFLADQFADMVAKKIVAKMGQGAGGGGGKGKVCHCQFVMNPLPPIPGFEMPPDAQRPKNIAWSKTGEPTKPT